MNRRKEVLRAKHREHQQIKQAAGGKEVPSPLLRHPTILLDHEGESYRVIAEPPSRRFMCCECNKLVTGQPYQFAGDLACQRCVANYYRLRNQDPSGIVPKDELEKCLAEELRLELPCRAREGDRILRQREKQRQRNGF